MDGYQPSAKRWCTLFCCDCKEQLQQRQETFFWRQNIRSDNTAWSFHWVQRECGGHWWLRIAVYFCSSPRKNQWRGWVFCEAVGMVAVTSLISGERIKTATLLPFSSPLPIPLSTTTCLLINHKPDTLDRVSASKIHAHAWHIEVAPPNPLLPLRRMSSGFDTCASILPATLFSQKSHVIQRELPQFTIL